MATSYLTRAAQTATSNTTATISVWIKRSHVGTSSGGTIWMHENIASHNNKLLLFFTGNVDQISMQSYDGSAEYVLTPTRLLRDTNGWMHIVAIWNTTASTTADRMQIWINGVRETTFTTANYPSQNATIDLSTKSHQIGRYVGSGGASNYWDGYMTQFVYVDGQAYAPTQFAETDSITGEWKPKASLSGITYGNRGVWLKMEDSSNLGLDSSGNSNNYTNSGVVQTLDNPSNVFATINKVLGADVIGSTVTFNNGNTRVEDPSGSASGINPNFISTLGMPSSGKWYCELKPNSFSTSSGHGIGIYRTKGSTDDTGEGAMTQASSKVRYIYADTSIYIQKYGSTDQSSLTSIADGAIVGMALDLDNGTLQYYVNGSARHNAVTGINSANDGYDYFFHAGLESSSSGRYGRYYWNFGNGYFATTAVSTNSGAGYQDSNGQGKFEYQPPTNFLALCTKNLNI